MRRFAEVVEMPRVVPSSATQNSATVGQPGPAMGSSCSRPMPRPLVKVAAEVDRLGWVEVGPAGGDLQQIRGGTVLGCLAVARESEEAGGAEVVVDPCSHSWLCFACVDHVFEYRWWVRQWSIDGGLRNGQDLALRLGGFVTVAATSSTSGGLGEVLPQRWAAGRSNLCR